MTLGSLEVTYGFGLKLERSKVKVNTVSVNGNTAWVRTLSAYYSSYLYSTQLWLNYALSSSRGLMIDVSYRPIQITEQKAITAGLDAMDANASD